MPAHRASTTTALDLTAFRTPLWFTPPSPPAPVIATAPPPRPPLKWQLLAIVRDEGGDPSKDQALFYDPDADSLRWLRPGESVGVGVGDRTVERVTDAGVEIRDGDTVKSIALRAENVGSKP